MTLCHALHIVLFWASTPSPFWCNNLFNNYIILYFLGNFLKCYWERINSAEFFTSFPLVSNVTRMAFFSLKAGSRLFTVRNLLLFTCSSFKCWCWTNNFKSWFCTIHEDLKYSRIFFVSCPIVLGIRSHEETINL